MITETSYSVNNTNFPKEMEDELFAVMSPSWTKSAIKHQKSSKKSKFSKIGKLFGMQY